MENLYTRKQIAVLIDKKPNYVGVYIDRGKLIEENKRIDIDNPINKSFIAKLTAKSVNKNYEDIEKKIETDANVELEIEQGINRSNVDYEKKKHEIKKLKSEISLRDLEFNKKKAKVMPTEFVIEIIQRYLNGTCGAIVNSGNTLIDDICKELKADNKQKLNYKKRLKAIVQDTVKSKHQPVSDEVIDYAQEYALMIKW